jgi:hypothetical protein
MVTYQILAHSHAYGAFGSFEGPILNRRPRKMYLQCMKHLMFPDANHRFTTQSSNNQINQSFGWWIVSSELQYCPTKGKATIRLNQAASGSDERLKGLQYLQLPSSIHRFASHDLDRNDETTVHVQCWYGILSRK